MEKDKSTCSPRSNDHELHSDNVKISELHDFKGHPFKVEQDMQLFELMKSIEDKGVLVPLIVRQNPYGDGYEIIAGHRRKSACEWAGIDEVPVMVMEFDDADAVIAMVDSNLQREHIRPSEKAFAYKMKLEAMKQQRKRTDLTFCQVGKKSGDNPTLDLAKVNCGYDETGKWSVWNEEKDTLDQVPPKSVRSNELLSLQVGESQRQISRYIRLTYLIPKILDMVDEGKIAFTIAVELSYLTEEQQYELYEVMDMEQSTPSLSQANRIKRLSQSGRIDMDVMYQILEQEKPNQREQIKIRADSLAKYFPEDFTPSQKVELIEKLVKEWHEKCKTEMQEQKNGRSR